MSENELAPDELAQAAAAAIADAQGRDFRGAARVLAESGLCGVCAHAEIGGLGLGIESALPVAAEAGRLRLRWPLPETVLIAAALGNSPPAEELASGERVATWALRGSLREGFAGSARHLRKSDWVLVADGDGGAAVLDVASVEVHEDDSLDPEQPEGWLSTEGARVIATLDAARFTELQRGGRILIAGLVNGAAEAAIATAATHVSTRVQFGRPLSAKQAVRHLLARMRLLNEASRAGVQRVLETDELGRSRNEQPMLLQSLTSAAFVLEKSIQLHGGMGFTWEVPLHESLREIRKFEAAVGSRSLARQVGLDFIQATA